MTSFLAWAGDYYTALGVNSFTFFIFALFRLLNSVFNIDFFCLIFCILFIPGSKLEKRPVTFGKAGTAATMLCVCHSPTDDLCFTGSDTGLVYVWQGTTLRRSVQAHNGAVCAMYSLCQMKQQVTTGHMN